MITKREKEVGDLAAQGLSNQEIADKLGISKRTVEIHRANLMKELRLKSLGVQLKEYYANQRQGVDPLVNLGNYAGEMFDILKLWQERINILPELPVNLELPIYMTKALFDKISIKDSGKI